MTDSRTSRRSRAGRRRMLVVIGGAALTLLSAGAASGRQSASSGPATGLTYTQLRGDERLTAAVNLAGEDMRLDDVVAALAGRVGLKTEVIPPLAPRKVSMRIAGRPAFAVMAALSSVAGASWRRAGDGYELFQTQEQIDLESRLKRASAAREAAFVRSQMNSLRSTLAAELAKADGERAPLADFIAGCDPAAVEAGFASALEDEPVISATDQRHFLPHFFDRKPFSSLSPRQQASVSRIARTLGYGYPAQGAQVGLIAACGGFRLGIARPDGSDLWVAPGLSIGRACVMCSEIRENDFDDRVADKIRRGSSVDLSGIAARVRKAQVTLPPNGAGLTRLSAALKAVAEQSGLDYVSDGYLDSANSDYLQDPGALRTASTTENALGAIARAFAHKMDSRAGLLSVTTLTPGLDLRLEPPTAVLNSLDSMAKSGKQPNRGDLLVLAQCSREQLALLFLRHPVVKKTRTGHLIQAFRIYPFLRFYGSLTKEQRGQAQAEEGLSLTGLGREQNASLRFLVNMTTERPTRARRQLRPNRFYVEFSPIMFPNGTPRDHVAFLVTSKNNAGMFRSAGL